MSDTLISDDLPQAKRHVRVVIAVVLAICFGLYIFDLYLLSISDEPQTTTRQKYHIAIVKNVIENFIAGAIAALALALTYRSVIQLINPGDRAIEIAPRKITNRLIENATRTRNYVFVGNTATFVSASVLPQLLKAATGKNGNERTLSLYLLDPTDADAINSYVTYKTRVNLSTALRDQTSIWAPILSFKQQEIETEEDVRAKIIAAIHLCAYASLHQGMTVNIFLRKSFTPFRADISDREAVLTQESAGESAMAFSSEGHFYKWYQKDADSQQDQSIKIDFASQRHKLLKLHLVDKGDDLQKTEASVVRLLKFLPYIKALAINTEVVKKSAMRVKNPRHGY